MLTRTSLMTAKPSYGVNCVIIDVDAIVVTIVVDIRRSENGFSCCYQSYCYHWWSVLNVAMNVVANAILLLLSSLSLPVLCYQYYGYPF